MVLIPLILQARDNASGVINRVSGALSGLNRPVDQVNQSFGGLSGVITGSILKANLLTSAFTGVMGAAQSGLSSIQGAIAQGTELQLQNINAASAFSSIAGKSYAEAEAFVLRFNSAIGAQAAKLPGITEEYNRLGLSVQDSLIEGFKDERGILQMQKFEDSLLSLSSSYGALTAASTRDIGNTALGLTKALGGGSIGELRNIAFFEQNQPILGQIERALEERGAGSLGDLELKERIELLQKAGESLITPDFIQNAGESVDGLVQGFRSTILDPTNGFLGIMRDVRPTIEGSQSVFSAFNDSLKILIGNGGVFSGLVELFQETGLSVDPMNTLYNGVKGFNSFLGDINTRIENLNEALDEGGSLVDMLAVYGRDLVGDIAGSLGLSRTANIGEAFRGVMTDTGLAIASGIRSLSPLINQGLRSASGYAWQSLQKVDWAEFGGDIGGGIGSLLGNVQGSLAVYVSNIDYDAVAVIVGSSAIALVRFTGGLIGGVIGGFAGSIESKIAEARGNVLERVSNVAGGVFDSVVDLISAILRAIPNQIRSVATGALSGLPGIGGAVSGAIAASLPPAPTGAAQVAALGLRPVAGPRADGQMPSAFSSLLSAAQIESRRAPAGASLVVANSSEAIIPRSTVRAVQPIASVGMRGVQIGSISVQVNEAKTPQLTAEAVLQLIQSKFEQEYNAQLA